MSIERRYLSAWQAGDYLGVSTSLLNKLRMSGKGPRFIKMGSERVLYDVADLDEWVGDLKRANTKDRVSGRRTVAAPKNKPAKVAP